MVTLLPAPVESNDALLVLVQAGDRAAFAAFYERHRRSVRGYLRGPLHVWLREIDDLEQNVWLRVWAKRAQYHSRPGTTPTGWLFTLARNVWVDWVRYQAGRRPETSPPGSPFLPSDADDPALAVPGPDVERLALVAAVRAAVATLTPEQRRVVRFRWLYDQSVADAVRRLGLPEHTIKQRQRRAFRHLRVALAAYAPGAAA